MKMWLVLLVALPCVVLSAPSTLTFCSEKCECLTKSDGNIILKCNSMNFLSTIQTDQISLITELHISHTNLSNLSKLKKFYNLQRLDLSYNRITSLHHFPDLHNLKFLNLSHNNISGIYNNLPFKQIETLDLSFNSFIHIPQELLHYSQLKTLNFYGNFLICSCDYNDVRIHQELIARGIVFIRPLECSMPLELQGKHLSGLKCYVKAQHLNSEHSSNTIFSNEVSEDDDIFHNEMKNVFMIQNNSLEFANQIDVDTNLEGSGENSDLDGIEGSGETEETEDISHSDDSLPSICHFNCSTPVPLEVNKNETKKPLGFDVMGKVLWEDLTGKTTTTTETPVLEVINIKNKKLLNEHQIPTKTPKNEVESTNGKTDLKELDRQLHKPSDTANTTYIVVTALLILIVGLIFYVFIKRRKMSTLNRNNTTEKVDEKNNKIEMNELLKKPSPVIELPPEKSPLIEQNTQNKLDSDRKASSNNSVKNDGNIFVPPAPEEDDLQVPQKINDNSIPEAKCVKVQTRELSGLKTPVLVNRRLTETGDIVTYVNNDS